ncbi:MAG: hypothetical protein ACQESG_03630 [Nanobdellota archaeon]
MRGQVGIEFIALMGIFFFIFLFMFKGATEVRIEIYEKHEDYAIQDLAMRLRQEVMTAQNAPDGYTRTYVMPKILASRYTYSYLFNTTANYVLVNTTANSRDFPIPPVNASTNPNEFNLTFRNIGGRVYVNSS